MFLERIRKRTGMFLLGRKLRKLRRNKQFVNLADAGSVGILFQPAATGSFDAVHEFVRRLEGEGKKVFVLGYVDDEKVPDQLLLRKSYQFFCRGDLDWYFRPKPEFVNEFIDREVDILMNLSFDDIFPLEYVHALSRARFKTGRFRENNDRTDLSIDVRNSRNTEYLIEQITHYLHVINRKQE
ncbi:MAG: hypothetical protein EA408_05160 [Marinilabiliales bacterium]|nr:MAG: hypothetical protein EA408_05160 [Marinilabiliales bacterium]